MSGFPSIVRGGRLFCVFSCPGENCVVLFKSHGLGGLGLGAGLAARMSCTQGVFRGSL